MPATEWRDSGPRGCTVVLASGDAQQTVGRIGAEVGADEAHGGLMPADKANLVADLHKRLGPVAMVGDGINDAPPWPPPTSA